MDLQAQFEAAAAASQTLEQRPDNMTLLRLYALYKQGSQGDASGERPGMTDFVARAKFDAWAMLKGTAQDEAKRAYIELVNELRG
ncbi:acyl-CoA-binding protein [Roseateles sp. BYS180W]|uniref:Acyl-CoA-binding protein n=1 Tax=Roseateles rivi TaxID=3299028 RepID=A0ABW7FRC0_9BURK